VTSIYVPSTGPEDWQWLLASPGLQWKRDYSAMSLADAWESCGEWPKAVEPVLEGSELAGLRPLIGLPEHVVPLPGGATASQTDLFVLARRADRGLVAIAVEGKVAEPFGETVGEWRRDAGDGKRARLSHLLEVLELDDNGDLDGLRYQLVHRTASALIEAERFGATDALMLVHSFSPSHASFDDFARFCRGVGAHAELNAIHSVGERRGIGLHLGWVTDTPPDRPMPPRLGQRFDRALSFARDVHGEQLRKGTDIPYIAHLLGVASLVLEDGGSEDEAIAALLHDAAEDAGGEETLNLIRKRFGRRVGEIVAGCSDTFETPKPAWKKRKQDYIDHLADADEGIVRVSLADKLHNARAILYDLHVVDEELWSRFKAAPAEVLWYYESLTAVFVARGAGPMAHELQRVVAAIAARVV
jgi:hypothetical protein